MATIIKPAVLLLFTCIICCYPVSAETKSEKKAKTPRNKRFSGYLLIGGGLHSSKLSQLDTETDKRLTTLDKSTKTRNRAIPLLMGEISYNFNDDVTRLTLENEFDIYPWISVSRKFDGFGDISLKGKYSSEEVWNNPYTTSGQRKTTDKESGAFQLAWDEIFGLPLMTSYTLENVKVKDDIIGSINPDLKRDGLIHTVETGFPLFFSGNHTVFMILSFDKAEMDGESNSYNGMGGMLNYSYETLKWNINTTLGRTENKYKKRHSEFNKTRDDITSLIGSELTINEPFNQKNYFISIMANWMQTDSNIDFFKSRELITGIGIGYKF